MFHGQMRLFCGNANPPLSEAIASQLGTDLGDMEVGRFADGEVAVEVNESVRGMDVFVIQPTCRPVNENLMELLVMLDAFKRGSAGRIVAVLPYYGYARQDKKAKGREPLSAKLVADLITQAGADRVLAVDLHSDQIQGFFDIPVDHLPARRIMAEYFIEQGLKGEDVVVVAPDPNATGEAMEMADELHATIGVVAKRRPRDNEVSVVEAIGELAGKRAIMLDDMIDTGGTMVQGARLLREHGAAQVHCAATHAVLSEPACQRLAQDVVDSVVVTNSIPIPLEKQLDKMEILNLAPLLAEAIENIHEDASVSAILTNRTARQKRMF